MSTSLRPLDLAVLIVYLIAIFALGVAVARRSRDPAGFTAAHGALPGWVVGLSLFGTFLSSNTFLGVPGKAFNDDWSSFTFSLSLPLAAWIAVRWFVPFYRREGHISAYRHFELRFGRWASTYAVACYLLTQLARIGSILFGVALALGALTGWPIASIILGLGAMVTLYTLLGGIEAVIWTDVVQSIVLTSGALFACALIVAGVPGGVAGVLDLAAEHGKLGLGGFGLQLDEATFWVVLLYGLFINLNNFGIDQSYVQRYHVARSARAAARSVWLAALVYVPVSLLFFFIGTALFAYFQTHPADAEQLRAVAVGAGGAEAALGDHAFPAFIAGRLPAGLSGLLIAALMAAAMSSIDTSLNSSATVIHSDLYRVYVAAAPSEETTMRVLRAGTVAIGLAGIGIALAMIGVHNLLDAWWLLSGAFAGGLLGLFLLGQIVRRADHVAAALGVAVGVTVIVWLTLMPRLPDSVAFLRLPLHSNLTIVVGTLVIFGVGLAASRWRARRTTLQGEPS